MFGSAAIKWVAILVIVIIGAAGLYYVSTLKASLAVSEQNGKILQDSISSQQDVIKQIKEDSEKIKSINDKLAKDKELQQKNIQKLSDKFSTNSNGQSRDFGDIARAKPSLVTKIVNDASEKSNRCVELMTGGPVIKGEKNDQCQELIDSLTK